MHAEKKESRGTSGLHSMTDISVAEDCNGPISVEGTVLPSFNRLLSTIRGNSSATSTGSNQPYKVYFGSILHLEDGDVR
jgi:hypothetical protein